MSDLMPDDGPEYPVGDVADPETGHGAEALDPEVADDGPAEHDDLLLRVAERYYFARRSMVEIAREFGISRFRVARLLDEGERRGAVRITLHRPGRAQGELSTRLKAKYGVRHAVVVNSGGLGEGQLRLALGSAGARLLSSLLSDGDVLGVGWGRAVSAVADAAVNLPHCVVVQLSGITGPPSNNSMDLVRRFAALTGETAYPLYAPLLVPDAVTAKSLRSSPGIAETFARFRDVSVALVAVGSWDPPNSLLRSYIPPKVRDLLTAAGLRAELGGIFLDEDGREIATPLSHQILSISAAELADVPTVIAVAGHPSKAVAIRAALRGGYVNALVTDSAVAQALLD